MGKTGLACILLAVFLSVGCKKQKNNNEPRGPVGPPPIDQLECLFYRVCLEDCKWANLGQADFDLDGCHSDCAADVPQEDLDANAALQSCLDEKCTDPDNIANCQITECEDENWIVCYAVESSRGRAAEYSNVIFWRYCCPVHD